jgi:hypothetical protein
VSPSDDGVDPFCLFFFFPLPAAVLEPGVGTRRWISSAAGDGTGSPEKCARKESIDEV